MPESGDKALLDVFCINDTADPAARVAGKVNLNTRQAPVLEAIISGAYRDEFNAGTSEISGTTTLPAMIANALITRTTGTAAGMGPLMNISELVGKWVSLLTNLTDPNPMAGDRQEHYDYQSGILQRIQRRPGQ